MSIQEVKSSSLIDIKVESGIEFSICTLVTSLEEYSLMKQSFWERGFTSDVAEFLYADNTNGNVFDAYSAIKKFLVVAKGKYIILCHQDILLIDDINDLRDRIVDVSNTNPRWGVLGNAGGYNPGKIYMRITSPTMKDVSVGPFPQKVKSVDENFMLVRSDAQFGPSEGMEGFHFYGTDLCLQASLKGLSNYVIDFHLYHDSDGDVSYVADGQDVPEFYRIKRHLIRHYQKLLNVGWIQTSCTKLYLSSFVTLNRIFNKKRSLRYSARYFRRKITK